MKLTQILLLAFFAVFLIYPLAYVFPGSASDEEYRVRLLAFGDTPQEKAQVLAALAKLRSGAPQVESLSLPFTVQSFPGARKSNAQQLADQLTKAGGKAEVVVERHWTGFYFQQAVGFEFEKRDYFPYFTV